MFIKSQTRSNLMLRDKITKVIYTKLFELTNQILVVLAPLQVYIMVIYKFLRAYMGNIYLFLTNQITVFVTTRI